MNITCAAIIKILCVAGPALGATNIELRSEAFWARDTVQTSTWKAEWTRSTEYPLPSIDLSRLEKACDEKDCVSYWRQCDTQEGKKACKFSLDWGNGYLYSIRIEASDDVQLLKALSALGVVVNWPQQKAIPFIAMTVERKGREPICAGAMNGNPPMPCHVSID